MNKKRITIYRHILKSLTWRVLATITTFFLVWYGTDNIKLAASVGIGDMVIKFVLYFLHERIWYRSKFGVKL